MGFELHICCAGGTPQEKSSLSSHRVISTHPTFCVGVDLLPQVDSMKIPRVKESLPLHPPLPPNLPTHCNALEQGGSSKDGSASTNEAHSPPHRK